MLDGAAWALATIEVVDLSERIAQMCYNRVNFINKAPMVFAPPPGLLTNGKGEFPMATSNATSDTIEIQLTRGYSTFIDAEDAVLASFKWRVRILETRMYAVRNAGPRHQVKHFALHRLVVERMLGRSLTGADVIDHIDGDGLNNRRANLRLCTTSQNGANRGKQSNNTSGFKGVSWHKASNRWRATINVNGKHKHIGNFETPEAAYKAYCEAAAYYFGEFAKKP
jgi:hypothetical protein